MKRSVNTKAKLQAGFSLVELMIAVLILAVGLLGLAELQVSSMRGNAQSESIMAANQLAQRIIEEVSAAAGDDPRFVTTVNDQAWAGSPFTVPGAGDYNVTYDVATNLGGVEGLSQITVEVASAGSIMTAIGARQRLVTMATLKRTY